MMMIQVRIHKMMIYSFVPVLEIVSDDKPEHEDTTINWTPTTDQQQQQQQDRTTTTTR